MSAATLATEVLAISLPAPEPICGVYFLIYRKTIIYVGSSVDVISRLHSHRHSDKGFFTRWACVECDEVDLPKLERAYILSLQPSLNHVRIGKHTHLRLPSKSGRERWQRVAQA